LQTEMETVEEGSTELVGEADEGGIQRVTKGAN